MAALLGVMTVADAHAQVPHGSLRVAYQQRDSGKLSESVHHLELTCADARCSLTTLTLNQCFGDRFYPKVQRESTEEGTLTVRAAGDGVLLAEQQYPVDGATLKYRFTYTVRRDPELARTLRLRHDRFFGELTGFSGAAVKQSAILQKVLTWELVPLKGRSPSVEARCKIMLDGVPE
jgi:hypothetical protein